jgi:hypothetical protein
MNVPVVEVVRSTSGFWHRFVEKRGDKAVTRCDRIVKVSKRATVELPSCDREWLGAKYRALAYPLVMRRRSGHIVVCSECRWNELIQP